MSALDALDRLEREATAGPWKVEYRQGAPGRMLVTAPTLWNVWDNPPDAALIALSRNHLRALIEIARVAAAYQRGNASLVNMRDALALLEDES